MKNKRCDLQFPPKYWDKISGEAKDLVHKMLQKDPRYRISAGDALSHAWFNIDVGDAYLYEAFDNFKQFNQMNLYNM